MLHLQPLIESQAFLRSSVNCKYILENSDHYLVEINRIDEGEIFERQQWLKVSKDLTDVKFLTLTAIDSSREIEERYFNEGYLKFNNRTGIFIEKFNSAQHQYQNNRQELEAILTSFLNDYFFGAKTLIN
jgi:hypothetical protein